jgi:hypothetical protein
MCPACLATAALIAAGAAAAGGVTAAVVKKLRPNGGASTDVRPSDPTTREKGPNHDAENRDEE